MSDYEIENYNANLDRKLDTDTLPYYFPALRELLLSDDVKVEEDVEVEEKRGDDRPVDGGNSKKKRNKRKKKEKTAKPEISKDDVWLQTNDGSKQQVEHELAI
ncbi:hypothetical protein CASFOL_026929 [Castilleja foliolosa]|uniref:Uncharacterized protein n=1 Tax=Castilleja foliolosa TaxID=1961234 RepID=A0ABD3CJQ7_9LAMI